MPPIKSDPSKPSGHAERAEPSPTVTHNARPAIRKPRNTPRRGRFGPQLREAMEAMAHEGISIKDAAIRAKMHIEALRRAFRKTHVKQAYNQLIADIRANAGQLAYLRINHLGQTAISENVKLEANKWVAGVDNIAPIKRVEGRVQVSHSFGGFTFGDDDVIDGSHTDTPSGDDD